MSGSTEELADQFRAVAREGYSALHLWVNPLNAAGIEKIGEVLELLDRG